MNKLIFYAVLCIFSLTGCEKEKPEATTMGSVPKQIIDKATSEIDNATEIAAERLKTAEQDANQQSTELDSAK